MDNGKLLSIIIPVYNTEKYIKQCLDSIFLQQVSRDLFEVICVDDCSTDNSYNILKEYSAKFDNLKILQTEVGGEGPSKVRNLGLNNATGKYVWCIDSDDYIKDNCLPLIFEILQTQNPQLVQIGIETFINEDKPIKEGVNALTYQYVDASPLSHTFSGIVSIKLLNESWNGGRFVEEIIYGEDQLFWLGVFCQQTGQTLIVNEEIYNYRTARPGSLMQQIIQTDNKNKTFHNKRFDSMVLSLKSIKGLIQTTQEEKKSYVAKTYQEYLVFAVKHVLPNASYKPFKTLKVLKDDCLIDNEKQYEEFVELHKYFRKEKVANNLRKNAIFRFFNKIRHHFTDK